MACYWPFKKEGDDRPLPCGKCPDCRAKRVSDWCFRCMQHAKHSDSAHWVTLTYANPPLSFKHLLPTVYKRDFQNFMKRLRKIPRDYSNKKIFYYAAAEYGEDKSRPHFHAIIFNSDQDSISEAWCNKRYFPVNEVYKRKLHSRYKKVSPLKDRSGWQKRPLPFPVNTDSEIVLGTAYFDEVNNKTVAYTASYMNKGAIIPQFDGDDRCPEFQLFSKGLGLDWLTEEVKDFYRYNPDKMFVTVDGFKKRIPRYFVDRIFDGADDLKYLREEIAVGIANDVLAKQLAEYHKNGNFDISFEQFRYERKRTALDIWKKSLKKRKKL